MSVGKKIVVTDVPKKKVFVKGPEIKPKHAAFKEKPVPTSAQLKRLQAEIDAKRALYNQKRREATAARKAAASPQPLSGNTQDLAAYPLHVREWGKDGTPKHLMDFCENEFKRDLVESRKKLSLDVLAVDCASDKVLFDSIHRFIDFIQHKLFVKHPTVGVSPAKHGIALRLAPHHVVPVMSQEISANDHTQQDPFSMPITGGGGDYGNTAPSHAKSIFGEDAPSRIPPGNY